VPEDARTERAVEAYRTACLENPAGYSPANHGFAREDVILQTYEILLLFRRAYAAAGWNPAAIENKRLLEVGCAWGLRLQQLLGFNMRPENLHGIDLQPTWIDRARATNPAIHWEVMSATALRHADQSFDASVAVMALSAMLEPKVIDAALAEMCRVSREFVLVIDNFEPDYENRTGGVLYFKGVEPGRVERLAARSDVAEVRRIGSFWTTRPWAWRLVARLGRVGLTSVAYAVAVRLLAPHSHRAYLVRLRPGAAPS
jgi:ubiquinone/menaquinone biosynthesis C-methylase UbiE